ncbi:hypothetical protein [Roseateles puraquae]|uniref:Uncharacterized protein n=1 Tax=Roseateles puraquae TaxID=431059 RepID=A0A254NCQ9_9BURK|nr:hypothetical protein [Roseateles puraquae]MDG0853365.1 hypothetical protein [Roseateles puraquae]OWR02943.1 hypothetical protein CDO81_15260 [Roseateles puraquae]
MGKTKLLKSAKPAQTSTRIDESELRRWVVDFDAAGCIPLGAGVCLALGLNPEHPSNARGAQKNAQLERAYRVAGLKYCSAEDQGRVQSVDVATAGTQEVLVKPQQLFAWLKSYLLSLPEVLDDWLNDAAATVRKCHELERTEYDDDGEPFLIEPLPSRDLAPIDKAAGGHNANKLKTAWKTLGALVLHEHAAKLQGTNVDWTFLPDFRGGKVKALPGMNPASIPHITTMKSHVVAAIVAALGDESHAASQYPGLSALLAQETKRLKLA